MTRADRRFTFRSTLLLGASAALLAGCATAAPEAVPAPIAVAAAADPAAGRTRAHDALFALFKASDEAQLKLSPLSAMLRGDARYADQFGDYLSEDYLAAGRANAERDLAALATIDRAALDPTDQIAYDVFAYETRSGLEAYGADLLSLNKVRPLNHFAGFHTYYPTLSSGQGGAPFKTVADYDNALSRHAGYVTYLDGAIGRFREGAQSGVVETKLTIRNVIEQLDTQLKQPVEQSPFYAPVLAMPADFSAADKARLAAAYRTRIADEIYPAMTRLRDYLRDDYLAQAREGHGLMHMKGGDRLYRYLVRESTTLDLQPEEIHQLGLSEVARIKGEMEKVRTEVGFKGDLPAFFNHLRTDPKFKKPTREALTEGYYAIGRDVDAKLPQYFSTLPKSKLEIRPYEPFREKFEAGGSYEPGAPDGSRPGIFYFNAYDLPSRTTPGMTTLYLHEGAPGHHFQISLANENDKLPAFMRYGGSTAFAEGWALYAETLGYEMGYYADPYQRFGTLSDEMLRAMRLVVDTGLHAKGWTREQAIAYMLSNSDMGRTDATAEVERYIAIPSQALAYKIGALTIQRLRKKAQDQLGEKFDIREFHDQVLMTGALPMKILEQKIDRWIATRKAG